MKGMMRWAVLAAAAAVIALSVLLLSARKPKAPSVVPPPPEVACADAELLPAMPLTSADTAPLALVGSSGLRFLLDGREVFGSPQSPVFVEAGEHDLRVEADGALPAQLRLRVMPFAPGAVEAQRDGPAVTVWLSGVVCANCVPAMSPLDTDFDPDGTALGAQDEAARALRQGDWKAAVQTLRAVPKRTRTTPRWHRQLALAWELSGLASTHVKLEAAAARAHPSLAAAQAFPPAQREAEATRQARVLVDRWNVLTEKYGRLSSVFGGDAPRAFESANQRFTQLSAALTDASKTGDVIESAVIVHTGLEVLRALVSDLRARQPRDCAWQARVSAAL